MEWNKREDHITPQFHRFEPIRNYTFLDTSRIYLAFIFLSCFGWLLVVLVSGGSSLVQGESFPEERERSGNEIQLSCVEWGNGISFHLSTSVIFNFISPETLFLPIFRDQCETVFRIIFIEFYSWNLNLLSNDKCMPLVIRFKIQIFLDFLPLVVYLFFYSSMIKTCYLFVKILPSKLNFLFIRFL